MEIKINNGIFSNHAEEKKELIFSDENLDNDNFVDVNGESYPLDELFSAMIAFDSKRSRRISRETPSA